MWFIAVLCEGTPYSYPELQLKQKESRQSSGCASMAHTTCKSNTEIFIEAKLFFVTAQIVYEQGVNCTAAYSNEVLHQSGSCHCQTGGSRISHFSGVCLICSTHCWHSGQAGPPSIPPWVCHSAFVLIEVWALENLGKFKLQMRF